MELKNNGDNRDVKFLTVTLLSPSTVTRILLNNNRLIRKVTDDSKNIHLFFVVKLSERELIKFFLYYLMGIVWGIHILFECHIA